MSSQEISTITSARDIVFSQNSMQQLNSIAELMASSACTVPKHLQNNKGDCFAIAMQAMQWGMNPYAVAQKTHLVQGILGYEAQLVNAVITTMAPTKGRLQFEWFGDWSRVIGNFKEVEGRNGQYRKLASTLADEKGCGVRVWATLRGEENPRELSLLLTQAGTRNSTLWADDPKQQLAYLAIKRWSRLYCPDVILGVYSADELETIDSEKEINPSSSETQGTETAAVKLPLKDLLASIRSMNIEDFKTVDPTQYSADEKITIRHAMTDRKKQIEAERKANVVAETTATRVEENPDWPARIKECKTQAQMDALLKEMPEAVQMELQDAIDLHYDIMR
jgi:hypothetical protein